MEQADRGWEVTDPSAAELDEVLTVLRKHDVQRYACAGFRVRFGTCDCAEPAPEATNTVAMPQGVVPGVITSVTTPPEAA